MSIKMPNYIKLIVRPADLSKEPEQWKLVNKNPDQIRNFAQGHYADIYAFIGAKTAVTNEEIVDANNRVQLSVLRAFSPTIDDACSKQKTGVVNKVALPAIHFEALQTIVAWIKDVVKTGKLHRLRRINEQALFRYYCILKTAEFLQITYLVDDMKTRLEKMLEPKYGVRFAPGVEDIYNICQIIDTKSEFFNLLIHSIVRAHIDGKLYNIGSFKKLFIAVPWFEATLVELEPWIRDGRAIDDEDISSTISAEVARAAAAAAGAAGKGTKRTH